MAVPPSGPLNSRVLVIGKAPGCISGSTLIETAFRDKSVHPNGIPIRDLVGQSGFYVYSFDTSTQSLAIGRVVRVWKTGYKPVFKVTYEWRYAKRNNESITLRNSLTVTSNHPFLMKRRHTKNDPFAGSIAPIKEYMSIDDGLTIGHGIQPFLIHGGDTYRWIGTAYDSMVREGRYLLEFLEKRKLTRKEECHHKDENKLNDRMENLVLLSTAEHARHHAIKNNPMGTPEAKEKHRAAIASSDYREGQSRNQKRLFADPDFYNARVQEIRENRAPKISSTLKNRFKDPSFYWNYLLARVNSDKLELSIDDAEKKFRKRFPGAPLPDNHCVVSIEAVGSEDVYDIEVEGFHNFAAHGVFIHNSEEVRAGIPFIGRAGKEHRSYCTRHSLSPYSFRTTNLCRVFIPPDERLTPTQIEEWTPDLLAEIDRVRPSLIIPIGSDPVRWFLGGGADLKTVHGIPHRPGEFDPSLSYRAPEGCCILPCIQPAAGFHSSDTRALIDWDYSQVRRVLSLIEQGREKEIDYRSDPYAGQEDFHDVTGGELADILLSSYPSILGLDTEGTVSDSFCLQVCFSPPTAYMLRIDQPDFMEGIEALRILAAAGTIFTGHNLGMYDLEMCRRAFSLDLFDAHCHDTLFDAYLFCIEPLGLKPNSWRHLGMRMKSHSETVGALGVEFQLDYLQRVIAHTRSWPKPDPIFELQNDGQMKVTWKPQPISTRVQAIFTAIEKGGEMGEDGEGGEGGLGTDEPETGDSIASQINGVDPRKRWGMIRKDLPDLVRRVESEIGRMPHATMRRLYERDPEAAIHYSCMDSLGHYRLYFPFTERLEREGKTRLAAEYSINMHVYSEMQENKLPALRSRLVAVRDRMTEKMLEIVEDISTLYNDGIPFNPKSSPQKGKLLEKWGLKGTKLTKAKKVSYGKKSIEHWRFITENMTPEEKFRRELVVKLLFWGEHQHTRDMFCKPALERIPEDQEECWVGGQIIPWGTQTRRLAMRNLNLLAQPKHSPFGKAVRGCYVAPEGYVFLESDLKSIEVCVMADESGDPTLCSLLQSDIDFHRETAARYFEIPKPEITDVQRTFGKRIIFGTFFGQTGQGLREQLWMQGLIHFTDEICQDGIDGVKYRVYPGIGRYEKRVEGWLRGTPRNPNPNGSIRTRAGMERLLPSIHSEDKATQREAVRHGVSQKIQGGAQDLLQTSLSWLKGEIRRLREETGIDVRWLLTIHDSLLLLVPAWAVDIVREVVEEGLTEHCGVRLRVPVRAESKTAKTWGEL